MNYLLHFNLIIAVNNFSNIIKHNARFVKSIKIESFEVRRCTQRAYYWTQLRDWYQES